MIGIVSTQEAVFDQLAHGLAMRTLGNFELGIEIVEVELGRTNAAAHRRLSHLVATISSVASWKMDSVERSQVQHDQIEFRFAKTGRGNGGIRCI